MPKRDKNRQSLFSKATLSAAMAENPSVMTAAGWRSDENGDIVQDMQDDPGVRRLANNLSEISLMPLYDLGIGFAGEALLSIPKVRNAVASYRIAKEIGKSAKSFSKASKRSAGKLVPYSDGLRESAPISKELPVSSSDASITRAEPYSGYTPTDQTRAQSFVDDIKEALDWESKRGKALPSTNEYINLNPRDYIGDGREAYVYSNPENPEEVLKVMHGEAVPGVGIRQVPNFETPEEAIGFAERYVSEKNMRPYNLVENVVGVTDSGANGYAPILSQRKVVPANKAYNKTWEEIDADITKLGERIGDRHYTSNIRARADRKYIPESGRRPTNNIIYENDFQKAMVDPDNNKVYFETKDLRKDNVGYLPDGTLVGFDLFKKGGRKKTLLSEPSGYTGGGVSGGRVYTLPDVNPDEFKLRQRYAESGFRDNLTSPAGAIGRYQVMPITYKEYTQRTGKTGDLLDPAFNEGLRDWYMDINLPKYEAIKRGNPSDIVREYRKYAAYNMGPGGLNKALTKAVNAGVDIDNTTEWISYLPKETRDYVNFIVGGRDIKDTSKTAELYDAARKKYGLFSGGGGIHIKESKKGTFTAAAKAHGKSVQAFASKVLANKDNYSPAMVKKAVFAHNSAKWHSDGGAINQAIDDGKIDILLAAINNVRNRKV